MFHNVTKNSPSRPQNSIQHLPIVKLKDLIYIPVQTPRRKTRNEILANLSTSLYAELEPFMQKVKLTRGETIFEPGSDINYVYFPDNFIASRLVVMEDGSMIEVGMFGHEGMLGIRGLMGAEKTLCLTLAENDGTAIRIETNTLKNLFQKSKELQNAFLHFYEKFLTQISQRAACRCRHTISKQLCTWLLQFQERSSENELSLTQETIAQRLGARRSSITVAMNELETKKIISCARGSIEIRDRSSLAREACECYAILQSESIKSFAAIDAH